MAQRWGQLPTKLLEDDFAFYVNATVYFNSEEYYDAQRPEGRAPRQRSPKEIRELAKRTNDAFERRDAFMPGQG